MKKWERDLHDRLRKESAAAPDASTVAERIQQFVRQPLGAAPAWDEIRAHPELGRFVGDAPTDVTAYGLWDRAIWHWRDTGDTALMSALKRARIPESEQATDALADILEHGLSAARGVPRGYRPRPERRLRHDRDVILWRIVELLKVWRVADKEGGLLSEQLTGTFGDLMDDYASVARYVTGESCLYEAAADLFNAMRDHAPEPLCGRVDDIVQALGESSATSAREAVALAPTDEGAIDRSGQNLWDYLDPH